MKVESEKWKVETKKSARFGADGNKMSQVITFYFSNRGRRGNIRYLSLSNALCTENCTTLYRNSSRCEL